MSGEYTPVSGNVLTAANWNSYVRPQVITIATSAPSASLSEGRHWYDTTNHIMKVYGSDGAWVCVTPQTANVPTSQSTASTSYTDLATTGPAVTIATGTTALVTISALMYANTAPNDIFMTFAVSGATTIAASSNEAYRISTAAATGACYSRTYKFTGLTAGNNTFTCKYKIAGGANGNFQDRDITVVGLP